MTEVVERVARLEEQFDAVDQKLTDVQNEMRTGFAEMKQAIAHTDSRLDTGLAELRTEMRTQLRWMLGGIGGATLVILLAIVGQMLLGR